ncbi:MAG: hypothetical protein NVS3B14_07650 [Ktedonobacteraceae bacterium]
MPAGENAKDRHVHYRVDKATVAQVANKGNLHSAQTYVTASNKGITGYRQHTSLTVHHRTIIQDTIASYYERLMNEV